MIPLLDLREVNALAQDRIEEAMLRVARSGRYILGPEVEAFEQEWAQYCGTKYCVGTGNALDALRMMLMAHDIGPGDEVIVPSNTYIATWLAVSLVGAKPVAVEPDPRTCNIDPALIASAITSRTKAIMPVHLYGLPANMSAILAVASKKNLLVFSDGAQAHGANIAGCGVAQFGDGTAFSFYPSKNLGAMGDAGAVVTNDFCMATKIRRLRHYGGVGRVDHQIRGINSRMDEMQAAILRAKLPFLDALNHARRTRAHDYHHRLVEFGPAVKSPPMETGHVYHQYVIQHPRRDALIVALAERGIDAHVHYPVPPHLEGAYAEEFAGQSFPIAEQLAKSVLSLPIGNAMDMLHVTNAVSEALRSVS